MDIKLKNYKNKFIVSGIVLVLVTILSLGIVSLYGKIASIAENSEYDFGYEYIQDDLYKSNFVLNKLLKEKEDGKKIKYGELYLEEKAKEKLEEWEVPYEESFEQVEYKLKNNLKNLDYLIIDNKSNEKLTNTEKDLYTLINGDKTNINYKEALDYYAYYTVIEFDNLGNGVIKHNSKYSVNQEHYYNNQNEKLMDILGLYDDVYDDVEINYPKNVTIVYGIPKVLTYLDDAIYYRSLSIKYDYYGAVLARYILALYGIIALVALVIPYKKSKEDTIIGKIVNIPFEILTIIIVGVPVFLGLSPQILYGTLNNTDIIDNLKIYGISETVSRFGIEAINVIYWMVILFVAFIGVTLLKYIFGKGLIKYLKENTLVGRLIRFINRKSKKVFESLSNIDFKEDSNKYILKVVGINFLIVSICSVIWFVGIFSAIIYSIVLFFILRKYMLEIKEKYNILLEATNKIAEGNLDVEIKEDLKVFEPVKKELEKIQKGFKKAVEEEVKSQKMKTDLITNVSHDLKTPLTSIVTYVDLLKDENLTEENRKLYIETIEKKAERLKHLIEDLFEMSKATSNNINLNIIDVDLVELIKQTEIELSDKIEASTLNIKWLNKEEKIIVPLDSQKTFRIFENLLTNAIKYSMENSRIYIELKKEENYAKVIIKNISKSEIDFNPEEIVERFQRGDKSRNTEGSGLGLAIAKSFVEIQDGIFNIETDGDLFKVIVKFKINK